MNTELRIREGSVVTPGADGMMVVSPTQMIARMRVIQQVKSELMQETVHYYTLGGNKTIKKSDGTEVQVPQFSLSKAGAEMLQLAFGFSSEIHSETIKDDPDARFTMTIGEWQDRPGGGKREKVFREVAMTGVYEVKSICTVYANDGRMLVKASGSCNNGESAFRSTPYADAKNPVLKRAEKRALVAGILIAAGVSDLFTQDLEDLDSAASGGGAAPAGGAPHKGWMSDGQRKLIFAKLNPLGYSREDVDLVRHHIDSKIDYKDGKPLLDLVAGPEDKCRAAVDSWLPKLKATAAPVDADKGA